LLFDVFVQGFLSLGCRSWKGLTLSSNLTWNTHIGNITSKANKLLGFLRRNLKIKNTSSYISPDGIPYPTLSPTFQGDVGLLAGL
jgi:hypothetical protein